MNCYFKSSGKLIKCEIDTKNLGMALVESQLISNEENIIPDGPILAAIDGVLSSDTH